MKNDKTLHRAIHPRCSNLRRLLLRAILKTMSLKLRAIGYLRKKDPKGFENP